jgi:virulence factor Mce-like protein
MTLRYTGALRAGVVFVAATTALLLTALLINLNFGLPFNLSLWPPGQDYVLNASFKDANGVTRGADVVIAGHPVGQVTSVNVNGDRSIVTMRINQQYAPIHQGSIARIRYATLLAQKYVELAPVSRNAAIPSGGTIPSTETITPVDFDQFLSALDPQTRAKLQVVIQQAGGGVDGREATVNDLLDQLHGLSIESQPGLDAFATHDQNLDRIVTNLAITSNRLSQSHQNLGQLVQSLNDVNGRVADQNTALAALIRHLAELMNDFNLTLNGNEQNLHQTVVLLDPLIGQLNVTVGTTDGYLSANLGNLEQGFNQLSPEGESAIHQRDANGNYLRQYLVADPACDQINQTRNPQCGNGTSSSSAAPGSSSGSSSQPAPPAADGSGSTGQPAGGSSSGSPSPSPSPSCNPLMQVIGGC